MRLRASSPGHVRQDGGQAPGQHGLARAGRADQQQVVAAGGGDLQRPLHVLLPHHVGEVGQETSSAAGVQAAAGESASRPQMGRQLRTFCTG